MAVTTEPMWMPIDAVPEPGPFDPFGNARLVTVMVSSRQAELAAERERAKEAIRSFGFVPVLFEDLGAIGDAPDARALKLARECNVFVLIIGEQMSPIVVREYEAAAERLRDEVLVFVKNVPREPEAEAFVRRIEMKHTRCSFSTAAELWSLVHSALLNVCERAIAERQDLRKGMPFEPVLSRSARLQSHQFWVVEIAMRAGERMEALLKGSKEFDFEFMDEDNYLRRYESHKRNFTAHDYRPIAIGKWNVIFRFRAEAKMAGIHYLWIEPKYLIAPRVLAVDVEIRRLASGTDLSIAPNRIATASGGSP